MTSKCDVILWCNTDASIDDIHIVHIISKIVYLQQKHLFIRNQLIHTERTIWTNIYPSEKMWFSTQRAYKLYSLLLAIFMLYLIPIKTSSFKVYIWSNSKEYFVHFSQNLKDLYTSRKKESKELRHRWYWISSPRSCECFLLISGMSIWWFESLRISTSTSLHLWLQHYLLLFSGSPVRNNKYFNARLFFSKQVSAASLYTWKQTPKYKENFNFTKVSPSEQSL